VPPVDSVALVSVRLSAALSPLSTEITGASFVPLIVMTIVLCVRGRLGCR
jgi:hypothetical protein